MLVGGRRMFVPGSAMFVSSLGMPFRLFMLAKLVMVRSLVVMVGGSVMKGSGLMMMLHGRMLW
jgi:hypothetical protein